MLEGVTALKDVANLQPKRVGYSPSVTYFIFPMHNVRDLALDF